MRACFLFCFVAVSLARVRWHEITDDYNFDQYLETHPKSYSIGSPEYQKRKAIFDAKLAAVREHNKHPSHEWKKGLNEWSDLSDLEFAELFGKKASTERSFVEDEEVEAEQDESVSTIDSFFKGLPKEVDWAKAGHMTSVKQQCGGSCWAHTTSELLESGLAQTYGLRRGGIPNLSVQEVMSCTPNPRHCGGAGGCQGATVELAMKWVKKNGLTLSKAYPLNQDHQYAPQTCPCMDTCKNNFIQAKRPKVQVQKWRQLPKNKFAPLLRAVTKGPVAISVGTDGWQDYDGGVLSCSPQPNTVIGHAVLLVGYGQLGNGKRYWKVRNSWGANWGENGYVRLLMRHDEHRFCGKNTKPKEGTGCDGGPAVVPVCGTCGILFDSVVAKGVHLLDRNGKPMSSDHAKAHLSFLQMGEEKRSHHSETESEEEPRSEEDKDDFAEETEEETSKDNQHPHEEEPVDEHYDEHPEAPSSY
jgi:cathepsin L